jgi:hypothetical protein
MRKFVLVALLLLLATIGGVQAQDSDDADDTFQSKGFVVRFGRW